MIITAPECFLAEHDIDSDTVSVGQTHDDQCRGQVTPPMTDLLFTIDMNKCGIETTANDTHISYTAKFQNAKPDSVITRVAKNIEIGLRCDLA